ncbi:MAG TPA: anti-sigma factor [Acidothermaceae bacterium]|nr:anti-sigma factor [Acidothermaceae bacterium]
MSANHEHWAELAAGHVLSALDDGDEAAYLEHAATCATCRELERELTATFADLAHASPQLVPQPSLKASIMNAVADDDAKHTAPVVAIEGGRRSVVDITDGARRTVPVASTRPRWLSWPAAAAAAVVVLAAAGLISWGVAGGKKATIAAQCAKVHCPTATLQADGRQVGKVMVLDDVAYVEADGLPATPSGRSYVLWRVSGSNAPVGIAAMHTDSSADAVKAGALGVPVSRITAFAVSSEPGDTVPSAPTDVLAQGALG